MENSLLLNLLEKSEQIMSLVNLPESTINKYNELKQLTFNKIGLAFKPLINKSSQFN